jgi:hypothetical protein
MHYSRKLVSFGTNLGRKWDRRTHIVNRAPMREFRLLQFHFNVNLNEIECCWKGKLQSLSCFHVAGPDRDG